MVPGCKVSPLIWSIFFGQNTDLTSGRQCSWNHQRRFSFLDAFTRLYSIDRSIVLNFEDIYTRDKADLMERVSLSLLAPKMCACGMQRSSEKIHAARTIPRDFLPANTFGKAACTHSKRSRGWNRPHEQEGNGPIYLRRQGLWEIGMWCFMTSITLVNISLQMTLEVIWLQIWNQQPWLPWYPRAYCL